MDQSPASRASQFDSPSAESCVISKNPVRLGRGLLVPSEPAYRRFPLPGRFAFSGSGVHPHGLYIEATNESEGGTSLCKSVATQAEHHVTSMSTCVDDPIAVIRAGQVVRIHSVYDSPHPADDVMGIMLAYINPTV